MELIGERWDVTVEGGVPKKILQNIKGKIVNAVKNNLKNDSSYSSDSSSLTLSQQEYIQIREIMKHPDY